ncbi:MATE family efflux transporter [Geotalea uraniireducens]|uniref:MATE family efflux transporter n=1 Tax=Geotalea uraniireducens TaxID=351604 RepID=UPI0024902B82|nr:MATE family efflux transporter [Geotalea uraniireducens]
MTKTHRTILRQLSGELAALTKLSLPLIAAQLSQSAMGFVDTVMAGRVSSVDLAAVAMGSSIWFPLFLFLLGILMAVTPSVAQLHGAGRQREIGGHVRQALLLGLFLGGVLMVPLRHAGPLLDLLRVDPRVAPLTLGYLEGVSWGLPAVAGYFVLRHFSEGLSRPKPSMIIGLLGLVCNCLANYLLIYGKLGLPRLGGVGCGWATAFSMWAMWLGMFAVVRRGKVYRPAGLFAAWPRPDWHELGQLLRLGVPIGCALFIEASIFAVIALLIGSLGADIVAAHQISLSFSSLVFMVPMSIASAISVRVGRAIGRGEFAGARRAGYIGIGLTVLIALFSSAASYFGAPAIAGIYTTNPAVAETAAGLLALAALFQVSDAIQVSTAGALRGYKDTRVPMQLLIVAYWVVGLPLGYTLGLTSLWRAPLGAAGFWIGLIAGLTAAALLLSFRLRTISARYVAAGRRSLEDSPRLASGLSC